MTVSEITSRGGVTAGAPSPTGRPSSPATATPSAARRPLAARHEAAADAHEFWSSFVRTVRWDKPKTVRGVLVLLETVEDGPPIEVHLPAGATVKIPRTHPRIVLQNEHGRFGSVELNLSQLRSALFDAEPEVGATIVIDYRGPDDQRARGPKRFDVQVIRAGPPSG